MVIKRQCTLPDEPITGGAALRRPTHSSVSLTLLARNKSRNCMHELSTQPLRNVYTYAYSRQTETEQK